MKRVSFSVLVAVLVLAAPAAASRSVRSMSGVVVGKQHGVLLVATSRGVVQPAAGRAAVGARVRVRTGRVVRTIGQSHNALVRGVVVRRTGRLLFLSTARHLLVVHLGTRRLASASGSTPSPGALVQTTVGITNQGELDDQGEQQLGQTSQVQIQALVTAVGPGTVTVSVNGKTLTIPLPAGLTLPNSLIGTQVTLNVSFATGQATADEQGDDNDQGDQGDNDQGDNQDDQDGGGD